MTNYNDGKWHRWGGARTMPATVHTDSLVEYVYHDETSNSLDLAERTAGSIAWGQTLKFRVIREHGEPREFWIVRTDFSRHIYSSKELAQECASEHGFDTIHVREVIE